MPAAVLSRRRSPAPLSLVEATGAVSARQSCRFGMSSPDDDLYDAGMSAEFADYAAMGVKWLRTDFRKQDIQPTQNGAFVWTQPDAIVAGARAAGVNLLGILMGGGNLDRSFDTTDERTEFAVFAAAVAARYPDILHWELLNEPNKASTSTTPANYAELVKVVFPAVMAANPRATFIIGSYATGDGTTAGNDVSVGDYTTAIYAAGCKGMFHAISIHLYTSGNIWGMADGWHAKQRIPNIRDVMVANGDGDKRIWITEGGNATAGSYGICTEAQQEAICLDTYADLSARRYIGPYMWYHYQDRNSGDTDPENSFGIKLTSGYPKKVYSALKDIMAAEARQDIRVTQGTGTRTFQAWRLFDSYRDPQRQNIIFLPGSPLPAGVTVSLDGVISVDTAVASPVLALPLNIVAKHKNGVSGAIAVPLTVYYPNILANPTFNAGVTSWATTGANATIAHQAGLAVCDVSVTGAGGGVTQTAAWTVGTTYEMLARIARNGYVGNVNLNMEGNLAAAGPLTDDYVWYGRTTRLATTAAPAITVQREGTSTGIFRVDEVIVRQAL